jgi:hypothetical protein
MNMRVMEILTYRPDDSNELEGNTGTDMIDRLAGAFTHDGLVKGLWNLGSAEQQRLPRISGRTTGPLPDAGIPAIPGPPMGDNFGPHPDGIRREVPLNPR